MALAMLVSCGKDDEEMMIWDFSPIEFCIEATNAAGDNLLDPNSPAYSEAFVQGTYITFHGKEYRLGEYAEDNIKPATRMFCDTFHGMTLFESGGKTEARIGPFLSDEDWTDETIDIHWGDGSSDVITFSSHFYWKKKNEPAWTYQYLFNGSECTDVAFGKIVHLHVTK